MSHLVAFQEETAAEGKPRHITNGMVLATFSKILESLKNGAQCPCFLAINIVIPRKKIYPYLSELLARKWITIMSLSEFRHSVAVDKDFDELYDKARDEASKLSAIQDLTQHWYEFFKKLEMKFKDADETFFLVLTKEGKAVNKRISKERLLVGYRPNIYR